MLDGKADSGELDSAASEEDAAKEELSIALGAIVDESTVEEYIVELPVATN